MFYVFALNSCLSLVALNDPSAPGIKIQTHSCENNYIEIDLFTTMYSVAKPLPSGKAEDDLVVIQA